VGERYAAEVPFLRPAELADDTAPMAGVVTHALDALAVEDAVVFVILQPTVPFRTGTDVDAAVQKLDGQDATAVVSVTRYETPPQWACAVDADGRLVPAGNASPLWSDQQVRSQDLQPLVHPNGAIFAMRVGAWREHRSFYTGGTVGYEMPRWRSVDIDTPEDLAYARYLASEHE
jgi:CMP-N-acetylneuraminic acid synthetase